jgi:hypothetical protein
MQRHTPHHNLPTNQVARRKRTHDPVSVRVSRGPLADALHSYGVLGKSVGGGGHVSLVTSDSRVCALDP